MIGVRVPASTSNLGAGFDCLGLALDLWLEVRVRRGSRSPEYRGTLKGLRSADEIVSRIVGDALPSGSRLDLQSTIPVGRGLGASAAATVAGLAVRRLLEEAPLEPSTLFWEATREEGHPDNAGPAVYGGLVLAIDRPVRLALHPDLALALAVPKLRIDTQTARSILPSALPRGTAVAQASRAASLVLGLTTGDGELVARGMEDRIAVPTRKDLIPGMDEAVVAGRRAGAYGVTISGAGSTLVAVTSRASREAVAAAMAAALSAAENPADPATPEVSPTGLAQLDDEG